MLNQIIVTWSFVPRSYHDFSHGIELVIARKNHCFSDDSFLSVFAIVDFLFLFLHRSDAGRMLRVAFAALHFTGMTAAIEWKEVCLSVFQSRRHGNLVRIGREMNNSA